MRILALLGSPRKNGNTALLLNEYLRGIKEAGKDPVIDMVYLHGKSIRNCTACGACRNVHIGRCAIEDDMQALYPLFRQADMVVYATPIYWWNISAQLKSFIDRTYALNTSIDSFSGKKVALLMTYGGELPNKGPELVQSVFEEICDYRNMDLMHVYGVCTNEHTPAAGNSAALMEVYEMGKSVSG